MKLENRCLVPADRDVTWDFMMNIPRAAGCIPGIQEVTPEINAAGDECFHAVLQAKVGPMSMNLAGTITVLEQDREAGEAKFLVEATDRRVGGGVKTGMSLRVSAQPSGETELEIITDTTFMGRLGELGQPIIRRKARTTLEEFTQNVVKQLGTGTA